MPKKEGRVKINSNYVKEQLELYQLKGGLNKAQLGKRLGHSDAYIASFIRNGNCNEKDMRMFCLMTGIDFEKATTLSNRNNKQYKNDIRKMLNEVTQKQKEINDLLCKCWEEMKNV